MFRELGLIEQWESGFRRTLDEAEKQNLPEPVLEEIGMKVRFTVFLAEKISPGTQHEAVEETGEQVTEQVTRLLICLAEDRCTPGEEESREMAGAGIVSMNPKRKD